MPYLGSAASSDLYKFATQIVARSRNGEEFSRVRMLLEDIIKLAKQEKNVRALADLTKMLKTEVDSEMERRIEAFHSALRYKEEWEPKFRISESSRHGAKLAKYPHPDDVIIHADGTVTIDGPLNATEAAGLSERVRARDALRAHFFRSTVIRGIGAARVRKFEKDYAKIEERLPARHRRSLPGTYPVTRNFVEAGLRSLGIDPEQLRWTVNKAGSLRLRLANDPGLRDSDSLLALLGWAESERVDLIIPGVNLFRLSADLERNIATLKGLNYGG